MERYRFHPDGCVFFVTFSVVDWLPVFVSEAPSKIVVESLNYCHRQKGLRTSAYVVMPTHLHGIFFHETFDAKALEATLLDFRKFRIWRRITSRFHVLITLRRDEKASRRSVMSTEVISRQILTGRRLADFCSEHMPACFSETFRQAAGGDRERRFWQATRHPEQIETEAFGQAKADYLHDNPCRKGLVARADHWRFSSAAYWLSEGMIRPEVILSAIEW